MQKRVNGEIGQTPRKAVWKKNKATLWYYPAKRKRFNTPLFLVYSLLNQSYILDLAPGMSMIEAFTKSGYDVYLLDFGKPGYEDGDTSLDDYILKYIKKGVERALHHSRTENLTVIGYCLGGTLALIFAALARESIKNLILFAPPLDFSEPPILSKWAEALKKEEISLDSLIDEYRVIPAKLVEFGMRTATSPFTFDKLLSRIGPQEDDVYSLKKQLVGEWVNGHIPFAGAALKQLMNDLGKENKLIKNKLKINGQKVDLRKLTTNLLVVSTTEDLIVPEEMTKPLMNIVASIDKTYKRVSGGHISLALKGEIPEFLSEWLEGRSERFE
ncbi:alpha/beta fold hydrolase [Alkalihalophilus lindianensis]|uniref:Alpha/beta fold hydrolase n=1 Tax=Alkalihalophilus lindianensis TaxID=1630542 RepID=A0ABU3X9Q6_9BACI|nr:alpha/beta fold hydrolase [Alkalihalophilus lindianensis]MDV2684624.1 alpha/beta fold hydrolase [Alkalihalophilus lindianensis]